MDKQASNIVDVSPVSDVTYQQIRSHVNGVKRHFIHFLISLTIGAYLNYKTNVRDNIEPKKNFKDQVKHMIKH